MGGLPRVSEIVKSCPLPSIFLSNVNHVLNRLDELHALVEIYQFDVICITESWLNETAPRVATLTWWGGLSAPVTMKAMLVVVGV